MLFVCLFFLIYQYENIKRNEKFPHMILPFLIHSAKCLVPLINYNYESSYGLNRNIPICRPRYTDLLHCHDGKKLDEFPVIFGQIPTFKRLVNFADVASSTGFAYNFDSCNEFIEDVTFIHVCFCEFMKMGNIDCLILRHFLRIFFHKVLDSEKERCLDFKYIDNPDRVIEEILKNRGLRTLFKHWIECYLSFLKKFLCHKGNQTSAVCIRSKYAELQYFILKKLLHECNKHRFVGFGGKNMKHRFFFTVPSFYMINPSSDKATLVAPIDSFVNVDLIEK